MLAISSIIVFSVAAVAADMPDIPEWTRNPPENPNDLEIKLKEDGYENVFRYPLQWVDSVAVSGMPGLRNVVTATRTIRNREHALLVYYFGTEAQAKSLFENYARNFRGMMAAGAVKGDIISGSDTFSISYDTKERDGSTYYRLSGKVLTQGNIDNSTASVPASDMKKTVTKAGNEQAVKAWLAAPVETPPKSVLSKSDIDIFVKNHNELEKIMNRYENDLASVETMFEEAFGNAILKGNNAALTEAILKIRNFPVPDGLRSELAKFGLGDNAFEKIQVITYGGGIFANFGSMSSVMPEYGSEKIEIAISEIFMLPGKVTLSDGFRAAIHENDLELIISRIADLTPLIGD